MPNSPSPCRARSEQPPAFAQPGQSLECGHFSNWTEPMLHGIIPPVVTPMLAEESIDLPGLRAHIDFLLGHGVHGILVLGAVCPQRP